MEQVKCLMSIIDKYSDAMTDNDYLHACDTLKKLHTFHINIPKKCLTINRKMRVLLHKIDQVSPDMMPIFAQPYTVNQIEYAEWICRELNIDINHAYDQAREQLNSSHSIFL